MSKDIMSEDNIFDKANKHLYDCALALSDFQRNGNRDSLIKAIFLIKDERNITLEILKSMEKL